MTFALGAVGALTLLFLWEGMVWLTQAPSYLFPAPSQIAIELAQNWRRVFGSAYLTAFNMTSGFLLSVIVGVPLAMMLAYSSFFERTIYPTVVFLQIIPKIAIAPLFIIWFGFGMLPKVLLVFLLTFFPIVVNAVVGFKSVDPGIMELARSTGASPLRIFAKVRFPAALPSIFVGLKVSAALASTSAVVAEFVASDNGLGYLILTYNGQLMTPMVFGTIIVLSIVGLIFYYLIELLEHLLLPWHAVSRNELSRQ
jgi:NitT/TauT family transport system permease protein